MVINKGTIAKEINGVVEYVYPKTSADVVEYSSTQSVRDKLNSLSTIVGDSSSGLVKDINDLNDVVGDNGYGLIKDVNDLSDAIENLDVAGQSKDGLMSSEDKVKLDSIETGANKIIVDSELSVESTNPVQNKVVTEALNSKSNIDHSHTTVNGHIVEADIPAGAVLTDTTYTLATNSKDGLMSSEDKVKMDNINKILINDDVVVKNKTYSSEKIVKDYYTKEKVDSMFYRTGWFGTLEQYRTMLLHNPGMVYTTVDKYGNTRRFLGDKEITDVSNTVGRDYTYLQGVSSCIIGKLEVAEV